MQRKLGPFSQEEISGFFLEDNEKVEGKEDAASRNNSCQLKGASFSSAVASVAKNEV